MTPVAERELTRVAPSPTRRRFNYYRRIFDAYLRGGNSQLTFWHEKPEVNPDFQSDAIGEYYMPFTHKADYNAHVDQAGIPLLDYRGQTSLQYNPIAIAQYGLGNYNLWKRTSDTARRDKFLLVADWLLTNLDANVQGLRVWHHLFDWEYRTLLRAPWYSALAQGQGISVLVRAFKETNNNLYILAAKSAFETFGEPVERGGVLFTDDRGFKWFEEYIVHPDPPTHILNGFIWAAWGVWDYWVTTGDLIALGLFNDAVRTLKNNLHHYDCGYWSLYEQSGTRLPMIASPFYHRLHIVQLRVMHRLTNDPVFSEWADRWQHYLHSPINRSRAFLQKAIFKIAGY